MRKIPALPLKTEEGRTMRVKPSVVIATFVVERGLVVTRVNITADIRKIVKL